MNPSREDHLEAAKLAKAVSSQLNMIDRFSTERRDLPANRIDINKFIAQVVQPNSNVANNNRGYIPEDMVQKMVPDNSIFSKPENLPQNVNIPQPPQQQNNEVPEPIPAQQQPIQQASNNTKYHLLEAKSDSLERIATAIEKYVDCYVKYHTIEDKEKVLNE